MNKYLYLSLLAFIMVGCKTIKYGRIKVKADKEYREYRQCMDACVYFICTEYDTASFRHYYDIGQQHKRISDSLIKILHGVYIVDGGLEYTVYPNLCPEQKTLNN